MPRRGAILLVEDNEDDIFFMKRAMKSAAVENQLQVVTDGQQAIDYLQGAGKFSDRTQFPLPILVLLDLKLPHKSGHEVLRWIRDQSKFETLVVIVLTTSRETSDIEEAYRLGANAYLVKPPGAPELIEIVKSLKQFWLTHNEFTQHALVAAN
jgi:CheY-like chemotaxis protein